MRSDQSDFSDILRNHATNMAQQAASLKQYADAWEPPSIRPSTTSKRRGCAS
jgi:hypothetical protein